MRTEEHREGTAAGPGGKPKPAEGFELDSAQEGFSQGTLVITHLTTKGMQETWVQSLGWDDPLEEGMETHSSILAWRIPWTEKPGRATVHSFMESDTTEAT